MTPPPYKVNTLTQYLSISLCKGSKCNISIVIIKIHEMQSHRIRPYSVECTRSRSISEVKQLQAGLVLGWVTAWEYLVLYPFVGILTTNYNKTIIPIVYFYYASRSTHPTHCNLRILWNRTILIFI